MSFMSTTTYFDAPDSVIYGYGPLMFVVRQGTCNVIDQQTYDDVVHELRVDAHDFEAMLSSDDEDEPLVGRTKPRNEHQELEPVANVKGKSKTAKGNVQKKKRGRPAKAVKMARMAMAEEVPAPNKRSKKATAKQN
ncbi:hypothetical protein BJV82DRAFT_712513 [Fennellomyces sp. T-0311]|nr:hypothetical protein BJV82DRAFT_712513 [Fennellomyces sp. T-0311]